MNYDVNALVQTRIRIAEIRNEIRNLKDSNQNCAFMVEKTAIEKAEGNYGKNAEERERFLKNALMESEDYTTQTQNLLQLQQELELEEAKMYSYIDLRKDIELNQRDRMIEAGLNVV